MAEKYMYAIQMTSSEAIKMGWLIHGHIHHSAQTLIAQLYGVVFPVSNIL